MKVLFFLAIFALTTQVHNSEVTEFYRTFVNNIPTDAQTRNQILNDGLDCLNSATNALINSVGKIQQDLDSKNLNNLIRDVVDIIEVIPNNVLPKCAQTYLKLASSLQIHAHQSQINTAASLEYFQARLLAQIMAKTVLSHGSHIVAKDLATLRSIASGPIDANPPAIMQLDSSKYVSMDEDRDFPILLQGLLKGFGVDDPVKVKGTSECIYGITSTLKPTLSSLREGDLNARNNVFLDSLMPFTNAFERCQRFDTIEMVHFKKLITMLKEDPALSLMRAFVNMVLDLPNFMATSTNMNVCQMQGQFEQAGRFYAQNLRTMFNGVAF